MLVLQRNRMLKYLRREQREAYTSVITGLAIRPNKNFDPTIKPRRTTWVAKRGTSRRSSKLKSRPYGELTRPSAARRERSLRLGCDAHHANPRLSLASAGEEKNAKGRTRLRKHAVRQRRLQRARDAAARTEQRAAATAAAAAAPEE